MVLPTSHPRASTVDTGELYERNRQALIQIMRAASPGQLARTVPPTPAWTVHDVLAHVTGITADLNALDVDADDPEAWTARQIRERHGRSVDEIADEWDRESARFEDGLRMLGYGFGAHYVGDLHAHSQDVRMTLGLEADRDPVTVLVALDFYLEALDESLRQSGLGTLELHTGEEHHIAGEGSPVASVAAEPFELLRCVSGRRSLEQIRALDWSVSSDAMARSLSRYPLPDQALFDD